MSTITLTFGPDAIRPLSADTINKWAALSPVKQAYGLEWFTNEYPVINFYNGITMTSYTAERAFAVELDDKSDRIDSVASIMKLDFSPAVCTILSAAKYFYVYAILSGGADNYQRILIKFKHGNVNIENTITQLSSNELLVRFYTPQVMCCTQIILSTAELIPETELTNLNVTLNSSDFVSDITKLSAYPATCQTLVLNDLNKYADRYITNGSLRKLTRVAAYCNRNDLFASLSSNVAFQSEWIKSTEQDKLKIIHNLFTVNE